jgi:hypothetical protein
MWLVKPAGISSQGIQHLWEAQDFRPGASRGLYSNSPSQPVKTFLGAGSGSDRRQSSWYNLLSAPDGTPPLWQTHRQRLWHQYSPDAGTSWSEACAWSAAKTAAIGAAAVGAAGRLSCCSSTFPQLLVPAALDTDGRAVLEPASRCLTCRRLHY